MTPGVIQMIFSAAILPTIAGGSEGQLIFIIFFFCLKYLPCYQLLFLRVIIRGPAISFPLLSLPENPPPNCHYGKSNQVQLNLI